MKQLKILLLSLSASITLLLTFIISYLEPYELLFREYIYLIVVLQCLVLFIICLITLLFIHGIKYYKTKEITTDSILNFVKSIPKCDIPDHKLFPCNKSDKNIDDKLNDKIHKTLVESTNFQTKIGLLNSEYLFIPGYTVNINDKKYKVIHKFRTDLSDKDIYGLKWDYIFMDNGGDWDIDKSKLETVIKITDKEALLKYEDTLSIGDIVDLNRSLYKTELFNHKTQYSKADILGSKYVFIWQSNK